MSEIDVFLGKFNEKSQQLEELARTLGIHGEGGAAIDKKILMAALIFIKQPKLVYEIGVNLAGMAYVICQSLQRCKGSYVGFEIDTSREPVINMLEKWYPGVPTIVWGDSAVTVPERISSTGESPDIIFVDGGHGAAQVTVDLQNSLKCIKDGGLILVDDVERTSSVRKSMLEIIPENRWIWFYEEDPDSGPGIAFYQVRKSKWQEVLS